MVRTNAERLRDRLARSLETGIRNYEANAAKTQQNGLSATEEAEQLIAEAKKTSADVTYNERFGVETVNQPIPIRTAYAEGLNKGITMPQQDVGLYGSVPGTRGANIRRALGGNRGLTQIARSHLTNEQINNYNFLRGAGYAELAEKYMEEALRGAEQKAAASMAEELQDKNALVTTAYSVGTGLAGAGRGMRQSMGRVTNPDDYLTDNAYQQALNMAREDFGGGQRIASYVGEGIGAMLPSVAVGVATGGASAAGTVAKIALKAAPAITMATPIFGSTYTDAIEEGKSRDEATIYAAITATLEGALQYALGGIRTIGGNGAMKALNNVLKKHGREITNLFKTKRLDGSFLMDMADEGFEEYVQSVLEPIVRNIVYREQNKLEPLSEDKLYAALIGSLTASVMNAPGAISNAVANRGQRNAETGSAQSSSRKPESPTDVDSLVARLNAVVAKENAAKGLSGATPFDETSAQTQKDPLGSGVEAVFEEVASREDITAPEAAKLFVEQVSEETGLAFTDSEENLIEEIFLDDDVNDIVKKIEEIVKKKLNENSAPGASTPFDTPTGQDEKQPAAQEEESTPFDMAIKETEKAVAKQPPAKQDNEPTVSAEDIYSMVMAELQKRNSSEESSWEPRDEDAPPVEEEFFEEDFQLSKLDRNAIWLKNNTETETVNGKVRVWTKKGKLLETVRILLKDNGFRWSPDIRKWEADVSESSQKIANAIAGGTLYGDVSIAREKPTAESTASRAGDGKIEVEVIDGKVVVRGRLSNNAKSFLRDGGFTQNYESGRWEALDTESTREVAEFVQHQYSRKKKVAAEAKRPDVDRLSAGNKLQEELSPKIFSETRLSDREAWLIELEEAQQEEFGSHILTHKQERRLLAWDGLSDIDRSVLHENSFDLENYEVSQIWGDFLESEIDKYEQRYGSTPVVEEGAQESPAEEFAPPAEDDMPPAVEEVSPAEEATPFDAEESSPAEEATPPAVEEIVPAAEEEKPSVNWAALLEGEKKNGIVRRDRYAAALGLQKEPLSNYGLPDGFEPMEVIPLDAVDPNDSEVIDAMNIAHGLGVNLLLVNGPIKAKEIQNEHLRGSAEEGHLGDGMADAGRGADGRSSSRPNGPGKILGTVEGARGRRERDGRDVGLPGVRGETDGVLRSRGAKRRADQPAGGRIYPEVREGAGRNGLPAFYDEVSNTIVLSMLGENITSKNKIFEMPFVVSHEAGHVLLQKMKDAKIELTKELLPNTLKHKRTHKTKEVAGLTAALKEVVDDYVNGDFGNEADFKNAEFRRKTLAAVRKAYEKAGRSASEEGFYEELFADAYAGKLAVRENPETAAFIAELQEKCANAFTHLVSQSRNRMRTLPANSLEGYVKDKGSLSFSAQRVNEAVDKYSVGEDKAKAYSALMTTEDFLSLVDEDPDLTQFRLSEAKGRDVVIYVDPSNGNVVGVEGAELVKAAKNHGVNKMQLFVVPTSGSPVSDVVDEMTIGGKVKATRLIPLSKKNKTKVGQFARDLSPIRYAPSESASVDSDGTRQRTSKLWERGERFSESGLLEDVDLHKYMDKTYDIKSVPETQREGVEFVRQKGYDGAVSHLLEKRHGWTLPEATAAVILAKDLARNGNTKKAAELTKLMQQNFTDTGRIVNIAKLVYTQDEAGYAAHALRMAGQANADLSPEALEPFYALGKIARTKEFSKEDLMALPDRMQKWWFKALPYLEKGQMSVGDACEYSKCVMLIDELPISGREKLTALQRLSMLFNLKTTSRNISGNTLNASVSGLSRGISKVADKYLSSITGQRSYGKVDLDTMKQGAKDQFARERMNIDLGIKGNGKYEDIEGNFNVHNYATRQDIFNFPGTVGKYMSTALNASEDLVRKSLVLGDAIFRGGQEAAVFKEIWEANLDAIEKGTMSREEVLTAAVESADRLTYTNSNKISDGVMKIRRALDNMVTIGDKSIPLGTIIAPFAQTPTNVILSGLQLSPVGVVQAVTKTFFGEKSLMKLKASGRSTISLQREIAELFGRGLFGTGLMFLGMMLGRLGVLSGDDEDNEKASNWQAAKGFSANSIRVGDVYIDPSSLQGAAVPLMAGAAAADGDFDMADILDAMMSVGNSALEMPVLQGVQELFSGSYSEESILEGLLGIAADAATQVVPYSSMLRQVAKTFDPFVRTTAAAGQKGAAKIALEAKNALASSFPVARSTLPVKYDALGNPIHNDAGRNAASRVFNNFINPFNTSRAYETDVTREIDRLYEATGNLDALPDTVTDRVTTPDGESVTLNSAQKQQFQRIKGTTVEEAITELLEMEEYQNASDDEKLEMLESIYNYAAEVAKTDFLEGQGYDYTPEGWKGEVAQLADYGVDETSAIVYYEILSAMDSNEEKRQFLWSLDIPEAQKGAIDEAFINDGWYMSQDVDVNYGTEESFYLTQMSAAAQRYWENVKDMGITPARYYELYKLMNQYSTKTEKIAALKSAGLSSTQASEFYRATRG